MTRLKIPLHYPLVGSRTAGRCPRGQRKLRAGSRSRLPQYSSPDRPICVDTLDNVYVGVLDKTRPLEYLFCALDLLRRLDDPLDPQAERLLTSAVDLAWKGHSGQLRMDGKPYFSHPYEVAKIIADWGLGIEEIAAALCHDLIEDVLGITKELLDEIFGKRIANLVEGVSEEPGFKGGEPSDVEIVRKLLAFAEKDPAIIFIKLADRLHNMRTIEFMPEEKARAKAEETLNIYVPIADILGMWSLKRELEDLSFQRLELERYKEIRDKREVLESESRGIIDRIKRKIREKLSAIVPGCRVFHELRSIYELQQRMKLRNIDSVDNLSIHDIWRIQVVVPERKNCYVVLGGVHDMYTNLQIQDFISAPERNGHQFLHSYVQAKGFGRLLIQIRDEKMAADYRQGILVRKREEGGQARISSLLNYLETLRERGEISARELYRAVKRYTTPIGIFTPEMERIELYKGATVADFAAEIHGEVLFHATGAVVNGASAELSQELQDEDVVQIITDPRAHPSWKWLGFVHTDKARKVVLSYLKKLTEKQNIEDAYRLLNRESLEVRIPAKSLVRTRLFRRFISAFSFSEFRDLEDQIRRREEKLRGLKKRQPGADLKTEIEQLSQSIALSKKQLINFKTAKFLIGIGRGKRRASEVFAHLRRIYEKERDKKKEEIRKLQERIQKLKEEEQDCSRHELRYRKLTSPYWISIELSLEPQRAKGRVGLMHSLTRDFEELRMSIADAFPVVSEGNTKLVFAVNILGGRRGGGVPGQIQRLMVNTVARRIGRISVIKSEEEIERLLTLKKENIDFE